MEHTSSHDTPREAQIVFGATERDLWLFLFGLGAATQVRVVGALTLTELACILAPFALVRSWERLQETRGLTVLVLGLLWFLSAVATDLYRDTPLVDAAKGSVAILLLLSLFVMAFHLLADGFAPLRSFALGYAISSTIALFFFHRQELISRADAMGQTLDATMSWKTAYAGVFYSWMLAVAAIFFRRYPRATVGVILAGGTVMLGNGSRALFLMAFGAGAGALLLSNWPQVFRLAQRNLVVLGIALGTTLVFTSEAYQYSVEQGWMGDSELEKYEKQSASELGMLSGRSQFLAATEAIWDSPLIGHGSWAKDYQGYGLRMLEIVGDEERVDIWLYDNATKDQLIPCHSHLWQAWVWHGILGAVFWIAVLVLLIQFTRRALHLYLSLASYLLLFSASAGWSLLFSPFSARPRWGVVIAVCVLGLFQARQHSVVGSSNVRP